MVDEKRMQRLEWQFEGLAQRLARLEASVPAAGRAPLPTNTPVRQAAALPPQQAPASPSRQAPASPPPERSASPSRRAPASPPPERSASASPPPLRPPPAPSRADSFGELLRGRSLEDLVGGRVLAWVGGLAVLLGVAFLFAIAVSRGWIGEGARTLLAATGSTALLALGIWMHENRGRSDAAMAAVATGVSALFVTVTVAAQVYDLVPAPFALALAVGIGSLATALAVRWESQGIAALGILGGLISPVLADAPPELGTMAILLVAAGSAVGVLLRQRWNWLAFGVFAITVPQWVAFAFDEPSAGALAAVLIGFGAVGALAAAGHEIRIRATTLQPSSAFLLAVNALVLAVAGWFAFADLGHETAGHLWLAGLAAVHIGIGIAAMRSGRSSHDFGLLALTLGVVVADVAFALAVHGPARAVGFACASVLFAALVRQRRLPPNDGALGLLGLGAHVTLALMQALVSDAPLSLIDDGGLPAVGAAASLVAVASGCFVSARLADAGHRTVRVALDALGLAVVAYLLALTLDGAQLAFAWSVEAVALARLAQRDGDVVARWGARGHLALALLQGLDHVATPATVVTGGAVDVLAVLAALGSAAVAMVLCARATADEESDVRALLDGAAIATLAYLGAAVLDGAVFVGALAAGAIALTELGRRLDHQVAGWGAMAYLGCAAAHVLLFEAPPTALVEGVGAIPSACLALLAVAAAGAHAARFGAWEPRVRWALAGAAGLSVLYLASVLVVTPFQPGGAGAGTGVLDLGVRQQGQVLLSALWSVVGFAALVVGLRRDIRALRLGALGLLMLTVAKVFLFDLATLTSIYRVASFIALGLLLLAAAFVWQRMRPRALPDMREAPAGVR